MTKEGRLERKESETRKQIEEDQDRDPWSVLVDLYTHETRFKAESVLSNESQTLVHLS
jgi:hypothetical protein